jgi:hypothetical protein
MKTFELTSQSWSFGNHHVYFMYVTKTWHVNYIPLDGVEFGKPSTLAATKALNFAIANAIVKE